MPFLRVRPEDSRAVAAAVEILETSRRVDDPSAPEQLVDQYRLWLRYGWDLHPAEVYLYRADAEAAPVGVLAVDLPTRDNRHLVWADITVAVARRREGHGTAMLEEVLRRTREASRSTVWLGGAADDPAPEGFLTRAGFHYASHDARRRQVLADVDRAEVGRLRAEAEIAAADYDLIRHTPPLAEDLLAELAQVTAAINDAPMGDLTWEPEVFDADRIRDIEAARAGRGDRLYRLLARHRTTGELAGHTMMSIEPARPAWGFQGDTAVSRTHRGHRLGLLLKAEMLDWLAEVEPQLEQVETWNQADNGYMIAVNEALGYRLERTFHLYELGLDASVESDDKLLAGAPR